jgi:hypothetical protein
LRNTRDERTLTARQRKEIPVPLRGWIVAAALVAAGAFAPADRPTTPSAAAAQPAAMLVLVPNGRGAIDVAPPGLDLAGAPVSRCDEELADDDGGRCRLAYAPGTTVAATAVPEPGSSFVGFSDFRCGADCRLPLTAGEQTLAATFTPQRLVLRVGGGGRIVSSPAGIDCGGRNSAGCSADFPFGTSVTLTATGEGGEPVEWIFGCAPERGDPLAPRCIVEITSEPTIVVLRFGDANPPGIPARVSVELSVAIAGGGVVRGSKIDCGSRCEAQYLFNDRERLRAVADARSRFVRWEHGCGTRAECEFAVGPTTAVRAVFERVALAARLVRSTVVKRTVLVRVSVGRPAGLTLRLETRRGKRLASRGRALARGATTVRLAVPRRVAAGRYRVVVVVTSAGERVRFARDVRIGR